MVFFLNQPWPYLVTAAILALMGFYAWNQPRRPGTRYFGWMIAVWLAWALAAAFSTILHPLQLRYGLWVLQCVCVLLAAPLELVVILEYTGSEKWNARRGLLMLLALPALLFFLMASLRPSYIQAYTEIRFGIDVILARDPIKWDFFAFALIPVIITLGVLVNCLLRAPAFRTPILLLILGLIIRPVGFIGINMMEEIPSPIQVLILFTNITAIAYFIALFYFGMLRVIPVARDTVINSMPYSMFVLDAENKLVDFNAAALALPGLPGKPSLRQTAASALGSWWEKIDPLIGSTTQSRDVVVKNDSGEQIFYVVSQPLLQISGWRMGQVIIIENVTHARQAQRQQSQQLWAQATLEERKQLANELHDGLSQSLAFLNLQSQTAQLYLQTGQSEAAQTSLARLGDAADEIQEDTRELIGSLLSVSQPVENFYDSLSKILKNFEEQTDLIVQLEIDRNAAVNGLHNLSGLSPTVAVQLVRITQEALANIRKHACGASQVSVHMEARDGKMWLSIADDGPGFNQAASRTKGNHFGLQVMQQRAASIGGKVVVDSMPGKGTRIVVCIPLCEQNRSNKELADEDTVS
jgi:signal transduction histidine kinase